MHSGYLVYGDYIRSQGFYYQGGEYFRRESSKRGPKIPRESFNAIKKMSLPVLEVIRGETSGLAVHIGGRYVLTNFHVVSSKKKLSDGCRRLVFKSTYYKKIQTLRCERIMFCSKHADLCLLKMHRRSNARLSKREGAKLRIVQRSEYHPLKLTIAIGNTKGFGIHASSGHGLHMMGKWMYFYASVLEGNSGGGLFDESGHLIGIVRGQSKGPQRSKTAYNAAIPINKIEYLIRKNVRADSDFWNQVTFN